MLISREREKLVDAIAYFVRNTKYCGLTKLFKLLFFLDFIHFRETGRSVTGMDYFAWNFGPVPQDLFFEAKGQKQLNLDEYIQFVDTGEIANEIQTKNLTKIQVRKDFGGSFFTKREKRILEQLAYIFHKTTAEQISEVSHLKGSPWRNTKDQRGMKAKIDYMLSADGSDQLQLSLDELQARLNEIQETKRALS